MSKLKKDDKKKPEIIKEEKIEEFPEIDSYGKFIFQNQITYIGGFRRLKTGQKIRNGKGKIIHPTIDGSELGQESYEGDWENDLMHGYGIYIYSNGDMYEGEFSNNKQEGYGKYTFSDGSRYEGGWKNHRMHGTGKYWDINNVPWSGEFREGRYLSKEQAVLKEEKRINKKISNILLVPINIFYKDWELSVVKVDKKNIKDILGPFFAKLETMGMYVKENYPKLEDKNLEKWNEAIKFVLNISNNPAANIVTNVPKSDKDLIILDKTSLLTQQLQEDLTSGQVVEIKTILNERTSKLVLAYNLEMDRWLIVHFSEIIEKKK